MENDDQNYLLNGDKFLLGEDELVDASKLDEVSAK